MLGLAKKTPERRQAVERVEGWTRERFQASEGGGGLRFGGRLQPSRLCAAGDRGHVLDCGTALPVQLFKPVAEVVVDDVPYAWLRMRSRFRREQFLEPLGR